MNWYKQAQFDESPDHYSTPVKVHVSKTTKQGEEYFEINPTHDTVRVPFVIDIEARSWGIKGISVMLYETITVPLTIQRYDENGMEKPEEYKDVVVDLTKLPTEKRVTEHGDMCTLGDMDLYLDDNFNVDYKRSSIEIVR